MKDEELAQRLGVGPKEVAKAANLLVRDQLVSMSVIAFSLLSHPILSPAHACWYQLLACRSQTRSL